MSSATFFMCGTVSGRSVLLKPKQKNTLQYGKSWICSKEKNQRRIDQPQTKPKKANNLDVITRNDLWNKSTSSCKAVSYLFQFVLRGEHLYYYEFFFHFYTVSRHLKMLKLFYPASAFNVNIEIMILWLKSNLLISKVSSLWNRKN